MSDKSLGSWIRASFEKETPFLQQIPREAHDFFILKAVIREYDKGDTIIEKDTEGEYFYVVQTGRVQVCGEKYKGQWTEIAVLEKGSCFGEMSIISDLPVSNTIVALEDSTVLLMSKADFIRFVSDNPAILILLYKILADRLRVKNKAYEALLQTSMMGHFRVQPFVDLAQSFEKNHTTGTLFISNDVGEGWIAFKEGQTFCAIAGQLSGADALEAMLTWEDAFFRFDDTQIPDRSNLPTGASTTSLILDALRNIDERSLNK